MVICFILAYYVIVIYTHICSSFGWAPLLLLPGERRSQRFHEAFLRRQGHLSDRLSRRVKRIQNDHCTWDGVVMAREGWKNSG